MDMQRAPTASGPQASYAADKSSTVKGDSGFYGKYPRRITCQFCGYDVITHVKPHCGPGTHVYACLCFILCGNMCCLIPYCDDACQDIRHICPNCNRVVGVDRIM